MSEYINTYVVRGDHAYRVVFHVGTRRPMIVCRKTKRDETVLRLDGPTGMAVAEAARRQIWPTPRKAAGLESLGVSQDDQKPSKPLGGGE